jgi:hypothetical protein
MEKKEKLKEIIKNLDQTISKMQDREKYQSQSSAFETASASKSRLIRIRKEAKDKLKAL